MISKPAHVWSGCLGQRKRYPHPVAQPDGTGGKRISEALTQEGRKAAACPSVLGEPASQIHLENSCHQALVRSLSRRREARPEGCDGESSGFNLRNSRQFGLIVGSSTRLIS